MNSSSPTKDHKINKTQRPAGKSSYFVYVGMNLKKLNPYHVNHHPISFHPIPSTSIPWLPSLILSHSIPIFPIPHHPIPLYCHTPSPSILFCPNLSGLFLPITFMSHQALHLISYSRAIDHSNAKIASIPFITPPSPTVPSTPLTSSRSLLHWLLDH